jgi:hypothetical protein
MAKTCELCKGPIQQPERVNVAGWAQALHVLCWVRWLAWLVDSPGWHETSHKCPPECYRCCPW